MDSFLTACRAKGPLTLDIEGPGLPGPQRRSFLQPFVLIGRDNRAELMLDHDLVSRRHTYLQVIEGRVFFVDLESRSGTIQGDLTLESGWLEPGEALIVGPFTVRLVATAGGNGDGCAFPAGPGEGELLLPLNPLLARSSESAELPQVKLEFQSHTAGHSIWRMSQVLALVGGSPRCKVRLLDSNVSKLHCALLRTRQGLWILDLMGRGGIMVNGVSVRFSRLGPGDVVELGRVIVRPSFDDSVGRMDSLGGREGLVPGREPAAVPSLPERHVRAWGHSAVAMPAEPAYPTPVRPLERFATDRPQLSIELAASEPALSLLLNHFGQMQQQMLDQFQQSMMMMLQMFNGMHRDQMGLVREELDQLRVLNNEIQSIKTQLAARPAPVAPPSAPQRPAAGPAQGLWGTTRPAQPGSGAPSIPSVYGSPSTQSSFSAASRVPPPIFPEAQRMANGTIPGTSMPPSPPKAPIPQKPQPGAAMSTGPPSGAAGDGTFPPLEPPSGEAHDWLNDRLAAIEHEQQNRWQRIMGLIRDSGK
jgi:pSer/pThr/pTyr-binding forkhead associated (FHA) protein